MGAGTDDGRIHGNTNASASYPESLSGEAGAGSPRSRPRVLVSSITTMLLAPCAAAHSDV
ncbi:hypothetical protein AURDEDRAFT_110407 [Auricularia subglabra TFB-10046 SS5]|nr:hypothetical protein AURDEDRAFT_110407 [Auricularia subglabra TFB-10046 SS5]